MTIHYQVLHPLFNKPLENSCYTVKGVDNERIAKNTVRKELEQKYKKIRDVQIKTSSRKLK